ncbi:uncharacterized protein MONBRDRAFT_34721 [Monosiga brevicollis MX1]|uniref:G domain-containing protein n=1 Tax=Monosiga brevicollis TaxID=81824 RepID=A9VDK1_MONBE|nr:uncharacterized protein MONBRDRAFT_34721 [Monosiga brevicollis MX1]EDQ84408.1 predicted protein [Monosiga brevicollis MX1]|eukprot:XP_001750809.1 hypothetical protein [Monosiga brevicollis MX1]
MGGKKKQAQTSGLGKAVIKDRFRGYHGSSGERSVAHTSDLDDGFSWTNTQGVSVTEQNALDDFLSTAELAGTDFTAERENARVVTEQVNDALPSLEMRKRGAAARRENRKYLRIPRRPAWTRDMSAEELQQIERESFLNWRRELAVLQENVDLLLTPFERNLDFWRQLWRVVERSDVIVQIVDARNPLLFRCRDLEGCVKEVDSTKRNLLLINKADLLSEDQRAQWADYFLKQGTPFVFFSAALETQRNEEEAAKQAQDEAAEEARVMEEMTVKDEDLDLLSNTFRKKLQSSKGGFAALAVEDEEDDDDEEDDEVKKDEAKTEPTDDQDAEGLLDDHDAASDLDDGAQTPTPDDDEAEDAQGASAQAAASEPTTSSSGLNLNVAAADASLLSGQAGSNFFTADDEEEDTLGAIEEDTDVWRHLTVNPTQLYDVSQLMDLLLQLAEGVGEDRHPVIGLVGYPNVGKSSTINAICRSKRVSVSATPGKTKHFQTILLPEMTLCDCPGLVFPNFAKSKAELVCNGILPVDQLRDTIPPSAHVCHTIPRHILESTYGIRIIRPAEGESVDRPPTAYEFLNAFSFARGFMNARGLPDVQRGGRIVLKDYVKGKLLFCKPPPGYPQLVSMVPTEAMAKASALLDSDSASISGPRHQPTYVNTVDEEFFKQSGVKAVVSSMNGSRARSAGAKAGPAKNKRHFKKNKHEKVRRVNN